MVVGSGSGESRVPDRGDVIWLRLGPTAGHEQSGRRPAVVLSPRAYNLKTGLALTCPITSKAKGYPFEVTLPQASEVVGVVLADQVRSVDWRARFVGHVGTVPQPTLAEVVAKLSVLLA